MTYLIQLRNRADCSQIADQVILDSNTDKEKLTSLTDALFQKSSSYIFYYKNKRIISTLEPIIEEFGLTAEEVIIIDFIDEKDIKADNLVEIDDTVVSICNFNNKIYYTTYNGDVFELGKAEKICTRISQITAGSSLFGIDDCRLYDVVKKEAIHTFEGQIKSFSALNHLIAVTTESEVFIVNTKENNVRKIAEKQKIARSVAIDENILAWLSDYNHINLYNYNTDDNSSFKTDYTLVNLCITPTSIVATTSNNKILIIENNQIRELETDQRILQSVSYYNNHFIYASQYNVISCSIRKEEGITEHAFLKVDGNFNAIAFDVTNVYIANDNKIAMFNVQRLFK